MRLLLLRQWLLALALFGAALLSPALAQGLPGSEKLTAGTFNDIEAGINELAASGADRAPAVLQALNEGNLVFRDADRTLLIARSGGTYLDAATGKPYAGDAGSTSAVRVNNRIRRAIEAAMGSLTLLSPDAATRQRAAEAVYKARDVNAAKALAQALAKETDPGVKRAMQQAQAAIALASGEASEADKLAAVDVIRARGDQEAIALLRSSAGSASPAVAASLNTAAAAIESRLALLNNVQNLWYGLSLGSVLLLAAIGLAITFGVMGIINMAHGEMVMLGAYTTYAVQEFLFRPYFPNLIDWSLPLAIPLAFLVSACVGVVIERGIIRFLYGRPLETLLATFGVSLILQQAVRTQFGANNREVTAPSYMSGAFDFYGLSITYGRLWIIVFTLVVFVALLAVLKLTPLGLQMRAVTQNRRMASAMGIRTGFVDAMTFALGSGIAGIAGVALSQIDNVSPNLGQSYIVDSFMVVVFGGVGNLWGTLLGAFLLGIANKLLEPFAGAVLGKIAILVFIILFIQKRPRGLFALKGRAVEA